jgi:hypothetical protein
MSRSLGVLSRKLPELTCLERRWKGVYRGPDEGPALSPTRARWLNPRTLFALALLIVLLPLVIWLAGSHGSSVSAEAACVESWNQDQSALALGQHLFNSHGYRSALMVRAGSGGRDEPCLLVISALEPDPEYDIAAFLYRQGTWYQAVAGEGQITQTELINRQSEARAHPNIGLSPSGTLVPY